jgi:hypothetical protein
MNRNPPSEPGYYWRKGYNEDDELVMQVVEVGPMISTAPNELFYWAPGEMGGIYVRSEPEAITEWFGPINTPEEWAIIVSDLLESYQLLSNAGIQAESLVQGIQQLLTPQEVVRHEV